MRANPDRADVSSGTGSPTTRWLGVACLFGFAILLVFAFALSPEDDVQRDAVRMLYIHVPMAFLTYLAFLVTTVGSVLWLWKRSAWWDIVAHASAEAGVIFCGLTLFTGSVWGRPTWGTYWEWGDVRLVTTLILFLVYVGYLSVRSLGGDEDAVATRAAVVGLVGAVNLPIVNRSVEWWFNRTLHQQSSLTDGKLEDLTLFTMFLGLAVLFAMYLWLMIHRFRLGWLERERRALELDEALDARRAEASL